MRPIVNGLQAKYQGQAEFVTLDFYARQNQELVRTYRVAYHPTFVVLDRAGNVVQTFRGYTAEAALDAALAQATK
jgi:thioredoxin-related protein